MSLILCSCRHLTVCAEPPQQGLPEPAALRCHFEPLTGEVCIAGADVPDTGPVVGPKDGKSARAALILDLAPRMSL